MSPQRLNLSNKKLFESDKTLTGLLYIRERSVTGVRELSAGCFGPLKFLSSFDFGIGAVSIDAKGECMRAYLSSPGVLIGHTWSNMSLKGFNGSGTRSWTSLVG